MGRRKKKKLTSYTSLAVRFHLPTFITLTLITLIPFLYTLNQLSSPGIENFFVGLKNYINLFQDLEL